MVAYALPHRVSLYVPTRNVDEQEVPAEVRASVVTKVMFDLADVCGGASTHEVDGVWANPVTGQVNRERNTVVYAFVREQAFVQAKQVLEQLASFIKACMNQGAVMAEVDSQAIVYM